MTTTNENILSTSSQCSKIRAWLEAGFSITSLQALRMWGCMRLASRICDLRERGLEIETTKVKTSTGKWVTEYTLKK